MTRRKWERGEERKQPRLAPVGPRHPYADIHVVSGPNVATMGKHAMPIDTAVWFTWERQRRNREISRRIGASLHEFSQIDAIRNPVRKYPLGIIKTLSVLRRNRPHYVFSQNPSLVLCFFLVLYRHLCGGFLTVDSHNAGIFPLEGRSRILAWLSRFIQRRSDITIVSNPALAATVARNGGTPFVLPDPIPRLADIPPRKLPGRHNLLFICTYATDEPYEAVFLASQSLPPDYHIYVTGNYQRQKIDPSRCPPGLIFTGYLPETEYVQMLRSVDGTIDLTTREDCLVCGAYESVAAGKPMILSDTRALREYFDQGAVYTDNSASDIARCIQELIQRRDQLSQDIQDFRYRRAQEWAHQAVRLQTLVFGAPRCRQTLRA